MYGKIIRINLTSGKIQTEPVPEEWQEKYLGAEGINDRLLWEHFMTVSPHIDPGLGDIRLAVMMVTEVPLYHI